MARRIREQTLHTGTIAYLRARGLTELDYPVLVRPEDARYDYVVARYPVVDEANMYFRVWQPTEAMHYLAADTFGDWYTGHQGAVEDDRFVWEAVRRIHRMASTTYPDVQERGRKLMKRVSQHLTQQFQTPVPATSLATIAEFHHWMTGLVFPHHITASFCSATLLLMLGVPRERVAVFGMYFQDPTIYYRPNSDWRAGFMAGTPYYTTLGVYLGTSWVPIDLTILARSPREQMPGSPQPFLRKAYLGTNPHDGSRLEVDYEHPYTMVFAPTPDHGQSTSPLLGRIPLLEW